METGGVGYVSGVETDGVGTIGWVQVGGDM